MKGLDSERIAEGALAVADRVKPDGFTLKAVADSLGVTPMALYHYVNSKAELVALVVDRTLRELPLPIPSAEGWQQGLLELSRWSRRSMTAHPTVGQLQFRYNVWTPSTLAVGERWIALWMQSGLDFEASIQAAMMSSINILGMVHEEMRLADFVSPSDRDLTLLPNLRAMYQAKFDPDTAFDLLVTALIDGLYMRLSEENALGEDLVSTTNGLGSTVASEEVVGWAGEK